jgi:hypothetical protein
MVSFRLVSHSKKNITTFAQAIIDGATSGGRANKANSHKKNLEVEESCFIINLKISKS